MDPASNKAMKVMSWVTVRLRGLSVLPSFQPVNMAFSAGAIYEADVSVGVTGTMGNPDPANDDSVPGEVYFAIASKYGNKSYHANIPPKHSRYEYKLAVAELVADKLMEILGK